MVRVHSFVFNPFAENTYVLYDETREALIIDPGCFEAAEKQALDDFIVAHRLKVVKLINTHCHIDHVLGNDHVKTRYGVPLLIHRKEEPLLRAVKSYAPNYGFFTYQDTTPDGWLEEGQQLTWGASRLSVLFLPGHSPGHVALYHVGQPFVVSGDVLFKGSIGRTDLPGGDFDTLLFSIQQKLFQLPDNVVVYCGHGPKTTLGEEKVSNPFCAIASS